MARDLGEALGTAAHLVELRREAVGPFAVADATALDDLSVTAPLLDPLALLGSMERVVVSADDAVRLRRGQRVGQSTGPGPAALVLDGQLVAIGEAADGAWQPVMVLAA